MKKIKKDMKAQIKDYEKKKCKVIKEIEVFEAKEFIEVED